MNPEEERVTPDEELPAKEEPEKAPALVQSVGADELLYKANATAERVEKANAALEANLDRQDKMMVERALGGHTEAGNREKTPEELEKEEARKLLKGTGFEDMEL